jgi:hypothetical protein
MQGITLYLHYSQNTRTFPLPQLVLYFCNLFYFSVAITALSANIAVGSGRISLSFLYIRQFVAKDTPFIRFFA